MPWDGCLTIHENPSLDTISPFLAPRLVNILAGNRLSVVPFLDTANVVNIQKHDVPEDTTHTSPDRFYILVLQQFVRTFIQLTKSY